MVFVREGASVCLQKAAQRRVAAFELCHKRAAQARRGQLLRYIHKDIYTMSSSAEFDWSQSADAANKAAENRLRVGVQWLQSPEVAKLAAATKAKALSDFKQRFPKAHIGAFVVQVNFNPNRKATGEVFYRKPNGQIQNVFGTPRKVWSKAMIVYLGLHDDGFPYQLMPNNQTIKHILEIDLAAPIVTGQRIDELLNKKQKIYVTPTDYFTVQFRQIFKNTQITFRTAKYGRKWLGGPNMGFWPQQLNFGLWCATTGCGISREFLLDDNVTINLTPQLRTFYRLHVYIVAYKKLCAEFDVDSSSDFRYTHGKNHGLGNMFIGI